MGPTLGESINANVWYFLSIVWIGDLMTPVKGEKNTTNPIHPLDLLKVIY